MIIITKTKQEKTYEIPKMPVFQHQIMEILWFRRQEMLATISNIESVSVQVRDIKQMIYSKNHHLVTMYAKFRLTDNGKSYSDNDYITISNSSNLDKKNLLYALVSADWLLDAEHVEKNHCLKYNKNV